MKETGLKTLRNFLVANACALLPLLWVGLGWMPDQVKVLIRGDKTAPVAILCNETVLAGEAYGEWEDGIVWRFYLREGMEWKNLAFRLPAGKDAGDVGKVELQKWKLVKFGKAGIGLVPDGRLGNVWRFREPRFERIGFASGKIAAGLVGLEMLLLALSWWAAGRRPENGWKALLPSSVLVALAMTALMQVTLPVQSYLANQSAYPFTGGELSMALALRFAWVFPMTAVALELLGRCFGRWIFGVALAFSVCVYIESGVLSTGLPELNGDWWFFQNRTRALWDAAVWLGVFAVVLGLNPVLEKHHVLAAVWLLVAGLPINAKREEEADPSKLAVHDFCSIESVVRGAACSTNHNVLVFVLDSLEREQAHAVMDDPETGARLREQFRGFTEFVDNVGACPQTLTAVPNLLTGRYPGESESMADYAWSCYGSESVLVDFLTAGFAVHAMTPGLGCGYSTGIAAGQHAKGRKPILEQKGQSGWAWPIGDLARWRWMPFAVKGSCASLTEIKGGDSPEEREWEVYPRLARAAMEPGRAGAFLLLHTAGVHVPVCYDRHGGILPTKDDSEMACVEQGVYILGLLGDLMDAFRARGIYDRSLILVLGDHGGHGWRRNNLAEGMDSLPPRARPCLWVKPEGASGNFATSRIPTSHANVASLLRAAAAGRVEGDELERLLRSDRRVYREMALWGGGWTDWVVDGTGKCVRQEVEIGDETLVRARPLKCGKTYSLFWKTMKGNDGDVFFAGMEPRAYPVWPSGTAGISIRFRVEDPVGKYRLRLRTGERGRGKFRSRSSAGNGNWEEWEVAPYGESVLQNIRAEQDGSVTVFCERDDGPAEDVAFPALTLEME